MRAFCLLGKKLSEMRRLTNMRRIFISKPMPSLAERSFGGVQQAALCASFLRRTFFLEPALTQPFVRLIFLML